MSMEEENAELNNLKRNVDNLAQIQSNDNPDDNTIKTFTELINKNYQSRCYFIDLINQANKRRVNLALILTQFFSRYSYEQKGSFLIFAFGIVLIQIVNAYLSSFSQKTLFFGVLMTVTMIAFFVVTIQKIISALIDIRRLKRGFCAMGYQIVYDNNDDDNDNGNDNDDSQNESQHPSLIAYKDSADMIRTLEFPKKNKERFFIPAVLAIFLDDSNPYKVTILDSLPMDISYDNKTETFIQSWRGLKTAIFPAVMLILYAISMYMSYAAYTTLHQ